MATIVLLSVKEKANQQTTNLLKCCFVSDHIQGIWTLVIFHMNTNLQIVSEKHFIYTITQ